MNNSNEHLYVVILAGGSGTRLWPRSRQSHPKQLLDLVTSNTMLQETWTRVRTLVPPERLLVITSDGYADVVRAQLSGVPAENIIGEPDARNTAPSIGLAAALISARDPKAYMISLASDHHIQQAEKFCNACLAACDVAQQGFLVTLGIHPTYPETGYGYIQGGEPLGDVRGFPAYRVHRFTEKPDADTAAQMIATGEYYWNASIFTWQVAQLLKEFERYQPATYAGLLQIQDALGSPEYADTFQQVWATLPRQPIDTAIMEKADDVAVIPVNVGWSDVGSWAALHELSEANGNHNVVHGHHIGIDTTHTYIYSRDRLIATIGLTDMIVVDTGDAILICPQDRAQQVKKIVDELKKLNKDEYL